MNNQTHQHKPHKLMTPDGTKYYLTATMGLRDDSELIVCIHDIGNCSDQFRDLTKEFENQGYLVLTYDLIGRGRSEYPKDNKFDGEAHVNQLRRLMDHVNPSNAKVKLHLICHGLGGAIGTLYVNSYQENIHSMTLMSPSGLMNHRLLSAFKSLPSVMRSYVKSNFLLNQHEKLWKNDFVGKTGEAKYYTERTVNEMKTIYKENPTILDGYYETLVQFPMYGLHEQIEKLSSMDFKIMLQWATLDKAVPFEPNFRRWRKALESQRSTEVKMDGTRNHKNLEIKTYKKLGHGFYLEGGDQIREDIMHFIASSSEEEQN